MTDCNTQPLLFACLNRKKNQADFNGGTITSDAGALLLRELDKRIGLTEAISNCIPDPRHPLYTVHRQRTMISEIFVEIFIRSFKTEPQELIFDFIANQFRVLLSEAVYILIRYITKRSSCRHGACQCTG